MTGISPAFQEERYPFPKIMIIYFDEGEGGDGGDQGPTGGVGVWGTACGDRGQGNGRYRLHIQLKSTDQERQLKRIQTL